MSEVVRQLLDAQARADYDAVFDLYAPDVEWDNREVGAFLAGIHDVVYGHDGVRRWFEAWFAEFADVTYEIVELFDAGDVVFLQVIQRGYGRNSRAPAVMVLFGVWTVVDGRVARVRWFVDRAAAEAEAGL
jgi:ketosteroid isomerase-like protein